MQGPKQYIVKLELYNPSMYLSQQFANTLDGER